MLYGRRRVGKSTLLRHWAEQSGVPFTYWVAEKAPAAVQRRQLFANLINAMNPEMIVLGGTLSLAGEFLLPEITRVVEQRALRWPRRSAQIVVAAQGLDACVMGGIASAYHHILSRPKAMSLVAPGVPSDDLLPVLVLPETSRALVVRAAEPMPREVDALAAR